MPWVYERCTYCTATELLVPCCHHRCTNCTLLSSLAVRCAFSSSCLLIGQQTVPYWTKRYIQGTTPYGPAADLSGSGFSWCFWTYDFSTCIYFKLGLRLPIPNLFSQLYTLVLTRNNTSLVSPIAMSCNFEYFHSPKFPMNEPFLRKCSILLVAHGAHEIWSLFDFQSSVHLVVCWKTVL